MGKRIIAVARKNPLAKYVPCNRNASSHFSKYGETPPTNVPTKTSARHQIFARIRDFERMSTCWSPTELEEESLPLSTQLTAAARRRDRKRDEEEKRARHRLRYNLRETGGEDQQGVNLHEDLKILQY